MRLLLSSTHRRKLKLDRVLMIGRQNLHLSGKQLGSCFEEFGYSKVDGDALIDNHNKFAEGVLHKMGAQIIHSLDASDYENATIIHDLNTPIPVQYKNRYDLVLDSGTLEHVFNISVALKNCMELTKVGGDFIGIYPCNNFFGHGFYQFSSELFYRTLSKENGFEIRDMILFVDEPDTTFYSIEDTSQKYPRVQFTNSKPVYLYVLAKRISEEVIFDQAPLQMDYVNMKWEGNRPKPKVRSGRKGFKILLPSYIKNLVKALLNRRIAKDKVRFNRPFLSRYSLK